jgi:lipopolysaccharide biosynthesis regulator YciM
MPVIKEEFSVENVLKSPTRMDELREILLTHQDETARELGLATLCIIENKFEEALEHIKFVYENDHDKVPLLERRVAEIYIMCERFELAGEHLLRNIRHAPDDTYGMLLSSLLNPIEQNHSSGEEIKGILINFVRSYKL